MMKRAFYSLIILLIILASGAIYLLTTTRGLQTTLSLLSFYSDHAFTFNKAEGQLINGFTIDNLKYGDIKIQSVNVQTNLLSLLHGKINIIASWEKCQLPLSNNQNLFSNQATLNIIGAIHKYQFSFNANIQQDHTAPTHLIIDGEGDWDSLKLTLQKTSLFGGMINGTFNFDWLTRLKWSSSLSINQLDLSPFMPNLPGKLSATITTQSEKDPFTIHITSQDVSFVNHNEYDIHITPDLIFSYSPDKLQLTGTILIPTATVTPVDFAGSITIPNDVHIIQRKKQHSSKNINFLLDIGLKLGKQIKIDSSGLSVNLTGELNIKNSPHALTTATGELTITKGFYKFLGNKLKIKQGKLIYTGGPIANPGLNLSVTKYIRNITAAEPISKKQTTNNETGSISNLMVGMNIAGTLKNPKMTFFSEPGGLSNSDILSYLMFGVPSGQTSGAQAQLLMAAIDATNVGGNVTDEIRSTLGLTQLGFESSNIFDTESSEMQQNTSFVLGKYLTPKLYISYSVGLIYPINIFSAQYFLTKHWMLQSDSSTIGSGGDIFYTLETN